MPIVTRALASLALLLALNVLAPAPAQAAAPVLTRVEALVDGYALVGSGFGTTKAKLQVFEGSSPIAADRITTVTPSRITVRGKPALTVQISVAVGGEQSKAVPLAGLEMRAPSGLGRSERVVPGTKGATRTPPSGGGTTQLGVQSVTFEPASVVGGDAVDSVTTLTGPAPSGQDFKIYLSSSHPAIVQVPAWISLSPGMTSGRGQQITASVTAETTVTITATVGEGANARRTTGQLVVKPLAIESVTVSQASVPGGVMNQSVYGTVRLNSSGRGISFPLSSSHPSVAGVESASMPFPGTARSGTFVIRTQKIATDTTVTFSAGQGATARTATLLVKAPQFSIELSDTYRRGSGSPFPILGGADPLAYLYLNVNLKTDIGSLPGGMVIALSSSDPVLPLPATVTIPENNMNLNVTSQPLSVSADTPVTITARYGSVTRTAAVLVKAIGPADVHVGAVNVRTMLGGTSNTVRVNLTWEAPPGGIVVRLASSNPAVMPVPATLTVPEGSRTATTTATTAVVTQDTQVTVTAGEGANAKVSTPMTVQALGPALLSVTPATVVGGATATASLTLNGNAPSAGLVVPLASSAAAVTVPANVTVAANQRTATFSVTTSAVNANTTATITAGQGAGAKTATLTLPAFGLSSLSVSPQSLTGGATGTATGAVTLVGPAPAGGLTVPLASSIAAATVPAGVTVPANATTATFTITTSAVTAVTSGTITAGQGAAARTMTIIVRP